MFKKSYKLELYRFSENENVIGIINLHTDIKKKSDSDHNIENYEFRCNKKTLGKINKILNMLLPKNYLKFYKISRI